MQLSYELSADDMAAAQSLFWRRRRPLFFWGFTLYGALLFVRIVAVNPWLSGRRFYSDDLWGMGHFVLPVFVAARSQEKLVESAIFAWRYNAYNFQRMVGNVEPNGSILHALGSYRRRYRGTGGMDYIVGADEFLHCANPRISFRRRACSISQCNSWPRLGHDWTGTNSGTVNMSALPHVKDAPCVPLISL